MCGRVNFQLLCSPKLVHCAATHMVVGRSKEESRISFGAGVGLSHFAVSAEHFPGHESVLEEKRSGTEVCPEGSWRVKKWRQDWD